MARFPGETIPTQFRLRDETLAHLDVIKDHYELRSRAEAVRVAARLEVERIEAARAEGEAARKKTRKIPGGGL